MAYSANIIAQATTPGGFFDVSIAAMLDKGMSQADVMNTIAGQQFQQQIASENAAQSQGQTYQGMQNQGLNWYGGPNTIGTPGWITGDQGVTRNQAYNNQLIATGGVSQYPASLADVTGATPGGGSTGTTYPAGQTSAQRAATMLYNAMRGLPFISPEFLLALQAGQAPAPRTVTPQTLAALSSDTTLSDAFFSVIEANALYPASYLAEIARFIPKGQAATPSFI
jgi:hypothetical protein